MYLCRWPEDLFPTADPNAGGVPVIPLPNPGEGGPAGGGTIITVTPKPTLPCYFCNSSSLGSLRILNTAANYNAFTIYINDIAVVKDLEYAEISEYGKVSSGTRSEERRVGKEC